jgi:uncharacterized protein DUF3330
MKEKNHNGNPPEALYRIVPGSGNPLPVPCSNCKEQIPPSEAINPEAGDYALYFCGLKCYREWLTNHEWYSKHRR